MSLAFVRRIHRGTVNSPHKWPVTRKMFPFDDVIMICVTIWRHRAQGATRAAILQIIDANILHQIWMSQQIRHNYRTLKTTGCMKILTSDISSLTKALKNNLLSGIFYEFFLVKNQKWFERTTSGRFYGRSSLAKPSLNFNGGLANLD